MSSDDTNKVNTTFGPMSYIDSGTGPALVFIHGWPMQKETFLPITRILQKDFRCICFDLIDIGESRPSTAPTPLSFHQQVAALKEAISSLGLEQYTLVGQNSGGFIARLPAANNASVKRLILFNTEIPGLIPPWVPLFQKLAPLPLASHFFKFCVSTKILARSPMGFGGCFANKDLIHGEFFSLTAKPLIENPEKLAGCLRFLKSMDWNECEMLSQVHTQINAKVHCIWGEADSFFPVSEAREMFQQFTNPWGVRHDQGRQIAPLCGVPKRVSGLHSQVYAILKCKSLRLSKPDGKLRTDAHMGYFR